MKKGFTLLEVLLVISLITILAGVVIFVYPKYLSRSRDDIRKNDLRVYQVALENYANRNNGYYPAFLANHNVNLMCDPSILNEPACENDPLFNTPANPHYHYMSNGGPDGTPNATQWVLSATLEEKFNGQTYLWVACSDGRSGRVLPPEWFPNGVCPSNLLQ